MAQRENPLSRERFSCKICQDLLKDPVTIGCGHSYCRSCIDTHWDNHNEEGTYRCPQCEQTFTPRPVLVKNILLAEVAKDIRLLDNQSSPSTSECTHSHSIRVRPLRYLEDATAAASQFRGQLQDILSDTKTKILQTASQVYGSLARSEPKTRADFLKYSQEITLDPNTAYKRLLLTDGNRKVVFMGEEQSYADHPDRFTDMFQVLSRQSLTGRCYWEVEREGGVYLAVAYKNITREGNLDECRFGFNDKSWMFNCFGNFHIFYHNSIQTPVSGPESSKVGVYLDHSAGVLSFYSVSDTMTLLHRVQTKFTHPLHAGIGMYLKGSTAEFCKLK